MCFSSQGSCGLQRSPISSRLPALCAFQAPSFLSNLCKNRKSNYRLEKLQLCGLCSAPTKAEKCQKIPTTTYYFFCLFCLLSCSLWEISRSHNWPERKVALCYWKWWWLTLEESKKVQRSLKVLAYVLYFQRELVFELGHGFLFKESFPTRLLGAIPAKGMTFKNWQILPGPIYIIL